jgi:hypothetical protein
MPARQSNTVVQPNLGLYFDRPPIALAPRMLQDGYNFRIKDGRLSNLNLGATRFEPGITLNGAVLLVYDFLRRDGTDTLVFGTKFDLYKYNPGSHTVSFITPTYATGTAAASGTAVTGTGTLWNTGSPKNAKAGDEISFGSANQTSPGATWYTIASVNTDTSITLTTSAGVIADGVYTIRKKFTGSEVNRWVPQTFINAAPGNVDELWLTNGIDNIVKWNGATDQVVPQNTLGFTCKVLAIYSNMMIFANLVQGGTAKPTDIVNSDLGNPGDVVNGLSSQFKVHGEVGQIHVVRSLGDTMAIYSDNGPVTVAQFVGDPLIFVFRNVITGVGAVSPAGVADFGNFHEFLHVDSQYAFDGATVKEIGKQIWRNTLRQQDPTRTHAIYHHFDEQNGDLIWSVPLTTDPGAGTNTSPPVTAVGEHYLEDVGERASHPASLRKFPFTATGYWTQQASFTWADLTDEWSSYSFRWNDQFFFAAFPLTIAGDATGKLYTVGSSQDLDGAALPSFVRFGRKAVADGRMRGLIARIYPFVTPFSTALKVILRLADHAMGSITTIHTDSFDQSLPEGGHFTAPYRRGRYAENEFGTDGPGQPWELSGYSMDIKEGGRR